MLVHHRLCALVVFALGMLLMGGVTAEAGLVSYWDMDTLTGADVEDLAVNTNHGVVGAGLTRVLTGGPIAGSPVYYDYAGTADVINAGSDASLDLTANYSISGWFQGWDVPGSNSIIADRFDDGVNDGFALAFRNPELVAVSHYDGIGACCAGNFNNISSATVGTAPTWHHAVGTFEVGVGSTLYLDGALVGTDATTTSGVTAYVRPFVIGNQGFISRPFEAGIDDVALWDEPLTGDEAISLNDVALDGTLGYNAGTFDQLKQVHDAGSGFVDIGTLRWSFANNLLGSAGLSGSGDNFTLILDATIGDTGLASSLLQTGSAVVPEPATLVLYALALAALAIYAWRRRRAVSRYPHPSSQS